MIGIFLYRNACSRSEGIRGGCFLTFYAKKFGNFRKKLYLCTLIPSHTEMKKIFVSILIALSVLPLGAEIRDAVQAEAVALEFLNRNSSSAKGVHRQLNRLSADTDLLHIFADAEGRSVFVSGSTLLNPVLGYTDRPVGADTEMPPALAAWMQYARDAVRSVELNPSRSPLGRQPATASVVIAPLLGAIEWDQADPWNLKCPILKGSRTYVGCVATALSQIMYYYRYAVGRGKIDYTDESKNHISVDFSAQTYDFSVMGPTAATTTDKNELAKFCYHVGAASRMSYDGEEGSGAYCWNGANGASLYFSYSDLAAYMDRSVFTYDEWNSLLVNELQHRRPILYGGYSADAGHAFVLDGIDNTGAYHVNWGWRGGYNGYYDVNLLAPGGYGIGATASAMDGFREDQSAVFNLAPELTIGNDGVKYYCSIMSEGMGIQETTVALGQRVEIMEYGVVDLRYDLDGDGTYGILVQQDGRDVLEQPAGTTAFADQGSGWYTWPANILNIPFRVPSDLADGTYQVYVYFRPSGRSDRRDIFRSYAYCPSYVTMTVAGGKASFTNAWPWNYDIKASDWSSENTQYTRKNSATYTVDVTLGDENLYGHFTLLWNENGQIQSKSLDDAVYYANSTVRLSAPYTPKAKGTAFCTLYFSPADVGVDEEYYGDTIYRVGMSPAYEIEGVSGADGSGLRITKAPWLHSGTPAIWSEVTFAVPVRNSSDSDYNGAFAIIFHNEGDADEIPVLTLSGDVNIPADSKDTAYVTGILTDALVPGNTYTGSAYYLGLEGYEKIRINALKVSNKFSITAQQPSAIEALSSDEVSSGPCHNLRGQRVSPDARGLIICDGKIIFKH